ncbi:hypothetical protein [Pseudomonas syringae]|uniref:hypothetical protein n=1 Tax=Pseudomonas syringae TaxID=317 RepID=UPI00046339EF|nr:hypothetical protein [Pseudomonas syringae]
MDSYLSQAFIDFSSICSVVGLLLTFAVWVKTNKIKQDLVSKTRLPKVVKDLTAEVSAYIYELNSWRRAPESVSRKSAVLKLGKIQGILSGAKKHASSDELKKIKHVLALINRKRLLVIVIPLAKISIEDAEEISVQLNSLASMLEQRVSDLRVPV